MTAVAAERQTLALPAVARVRMAIDAIAWSYTPFSGNGAKHASPRRCSRSMP